MRAGCSLSSSGDALGSEGSIEGKGTFDTAGSTDKPRRSQAPQVEGGAGG